MKLRKSAMIGLSFAFLLGAAGCGKSGDADHADGANGTNSGNGLDEAVTEGSSLETAPSAGDFAYWYETCEIPAETGDVHPFFVYEEKKVDAPFTPDEFFSEVSEVRFGDRYDSGKNHVVVEKPSDILSYGEAELNWTAPVDGSILLAADGDYDGLKFYNIHDKDASAATVYKDMAYSYTQDTFGIFDSKDWDHDYSGGVQMLHQEDIEKLYFDSFGVPTRVYVDDNMNTCLFYWETNAYTVGTSVYEAYIADYEIYYWYPGDVTYYSAACPENIRFSAYYQDEDRYRLLWDNGPAEVEWDQLPAEPAAEVEAGEIKSYRGVNDIADLNLSGTQKVKEIHIVYEDTAYTLENDFTLEKMEEIFGTPDDTGEYYGIDGWNYVYSYGVSGNSLLSHSCPVEFTFTGEEKLFGVRVSFETAAKTELMGIDAYTTAEGLAGILGTPTTIGDMSIGGTHREQNIIWNDVEIEGFQIEYVNAYYFDGILTELTVVFEQ